MIVVQILSTYDPNEEYLGVRKDGWNDKPDVLDAHGKFKEEMKMIGTCIQERNADFRRKARFPDYNLLMPSANDDWHDLIAGHGIPNSIAI